MAEHACATEGCAAKCCLDDKHEERARRTHETFYCAAGHANYFAGGSKSDKLVKELRAEVRVLSNRSEFWRERFEMFYRESRQCPWPSCRAKPVPHVYSYREALIKHMERVHGMPTMTAQRQLEEAK